MALPSLTLECGSSINAISVSASNAYVVVAGRDVLKTYDMTPHGLREGRNLRVGRKKGLDLAVSDVSCHPVYAHVLATGSSNGAVLTWDISRTRSQVVTVHSFKHSRSVNRVVWHSDCPAWLLTCSQDAFIKLWDARMPSEASSFKSDRMYLNSHASVRDMSAIEPGGEGMTYPVGTDPVRDVAFDPFHPLRFASCSEGGVVSTWDVRMPGAAQLAFAAHTGLITGLHWHPLHPDILATAGRDRFVKVWRCGEGSQSFLANAGVHAVGGEAALEDDAPPRSLSGKKALSVERVLRPLAAVQTIASVTRVMWRATVNETIAGDLDEEWLQEMEAISAATTSARAAGGGSGRSSMDEQQLRAMHAGRRMRTGVLQYQLSTCSALDNSVCVWDLRHPYVPVAVFGGHRDAVAAIAWLRASPVAAAASDAAATEGAAAAQHGPWLMSAGKDGRLITHDPATPSHRPHSSMRVTTAAVCASEMVWCTQSLRRDAYWPGTEAAAPRGDPHGRPIMIISSDPRRVIAAHTAAWGNPQAESAMEQLATVLDGFTPPAHHFAVLALMYVTEGAATDVLCAHNAQVASMVGLHSIAQVWKAVGRLFGAPLHPVTQRALPPALMRRHRAEQMIKRRRELQAELGGRLRSRVAGPSSEGKDILSDRGRDTALASSRIQRMQPQSQTSTEDASDVWAAVYDEDAVYAGDGSDITFVDTVQYVLPPTDAALTNIPGYIPNLLESLAMVDSLLASSYGFDEDNISITSGHTVSHDHAALAHASAPARGSVTSVARHSTADAASDDETATQDTGHESEARRVARDASVLASAASGFDTAAWSAFRIDVVMDILRYYADSGDVQMCVTLSRVVGSEVERKVGRRVLQQWLMNYIDLLHRFQLWSPASTVMARCSDENIRRLNQTQTTLSSACASCTHDVLTHLPPSDMLGLATTKEVLYAMDARGSQMLTKDAPLGAAAYVAPGAPRPRMNVSEVGVLTMPAPAHCENVECRQDVGSCCICLQPVRGVYAWCQGCGHGGHLTHMLEWFTQYGTLCPTGCMHTCTLDASRAQ